MATSPPLAAAVNPVSGRDEAEQLLDPSMFLRVHRSFIVNAERVDRVKALSKGEYSLFIGGKLVVESTTNQDNPMMEGKKPIFGVDVWEHAYYL